ncbi:hypothetical protein G6F36_015980 [Rhizopus arrhizus]|nr:hypothetical protein G6F36_015980 [Rhizopus arrhizus]
MDPFDSDLDQNDKEIFYWEELHDEAHSEEEPYYWEHPEETSLEEKADKKPYRLTTLGDYFEKQGKRKEGLERTVDRKQHMSIPR